MNLTYMYLTEVTDHFRSLSDELDGELRALFGPAQDEYRQYNALTGIRNIVLCFRDGIPVGCAAMKPYDRDTYEVKRVFVKKEYRGNGISKRLMQELEQQAKEIGIRRLILETGDGLAAAVGLYRGMGYRIIENYGQYKNMSHSICMEKIL